MLSILIPNYNYNVFNLVNSLVKQCEVLIDFEVVVFDDASTIFYDENNQINALKRCIYKVLPENVGRSAIRNLLVKSAKYNWILFLDSDVLPISDSFITNYIEAINTGNAEVYFGGLAYENIKPEKSSQLRWYYGLKREALSLADRINKKPNDFFCSNLVVKKNVFTSVMFNETIRKYGYEDLIFNKNIIEKGYKVQQLHNPVFHLNLEDNVTFLIKTDAALSNLKFLIDDKLLANNDIKIVKYANVLSFRILKSCINFLNIDVVIRNFLLKYPAKIWLLDFYKLFYFLKL